jgi:hypothetical protein
MDRVDDLDVATDVATSEDVSSGIEGRKQRGFTRRPGVARCRFSLLHGGSGLRRLCPADRAGGEADAALVRARVEGVQGLGGGLRMPIVHRHRPDGGLSFYV